MQSYTLSDCLEIINLSVKVEGYSSRLCVSRLCVCVTAWFPQLQGLATFWAYPHLV